MTYQEKAEKMTPAQVEALLRALDNIASVDPDLKPGHVGYMSKLGLIETARTALSAVRTPIHQSK